MKNIKKAMVEVPATTLSAIKNMLFNSENGVDLSSIVSDLSIMSENEDLTAINVGLTFKGIRPELDKSTRYSSGYACIIRYEFIQESLILGQISTRTSRMSFDRETNSFAKEWSTPTKELMPITHWLELNPSETEVREYVAKQYKKA